MSIFSNEAQVYCYSPCKFIESDEMRSMAAMDLPTVADKGLGDSVLLTSPEV